jgi:hypothetical protein
MPSAKLPAAPWVIALANAGIAIVIYGGLGLIGLKLSGKLSFAGIWDPKVSNRKRLLVPAVMGVVLAVFVIVLDFAFSPFNGVGRLVHPPFPASIFASLSAGIGEEIQFRLCFISFWVWLISTVILNGRRQNMVFWTVAAASALGFALCHIPAVMVMFNFTSVSEISPVLILELILLNGVISLFAAYYMRRYGFLAAAGVHFWTDIVWHVVYGAF